MISLRTLFGPQRHLIALFAFGSVVPSILVLGLGWRLLQQDRQIERQQVEAHRMETTDLIASTLEQRVAATHDVLRRAADPSLLSTTTDSVVVIFDGGEVRALPAGRLLYAPVARSGREAPAGVFAAGEQLEYRDANPRAAATWFRRAAASSDAAVKAGALFAYARNLQKEGAVREALEAYAAVTSISGVAIDGMPADMLARTARCVLLRKLARTTELRVEAAQLRGRLLRGIWQIDRATFDLNLQQANEWAGGVEAPSPERLALTRAVHELWKRWRSGQVVPLRGAAIQHATLVTVLTHVEGARLTALVTGPAYARRAWISSPESLWTRDGVEVSLHDPAFRPAHLAPDRQLRSAASTGLPWTILVHDGAPRYPSTISGRRTLWLTGLVVLGTLISAGAYVVTRAVSRELAVARLQSDFVAAVSHEFRTPLTALRQVSELLLDRPHSPERTRAYHEVLQRQTDRLSRLVENLLDFGRMETARSPYRLQVLEIAPLVRAIVDSFRHDTAARGHAVHLTVTGTGLVAADPDALTNALWNLLDNAAKYSPSSEPIEVTIGIERDHVVIAVRDRGFGIPRHEQRVIWNKFVRGSHARAERIQGTGIGLAMVRHIVSAHRGEVGLTSEPDAGATFTMRIPFARGAGKVESWVES